MADIVSTIKQVFPLRTVVIVGDLVADQFLNGTISRVSREAPVFILRHDDTTTLPGAAANAAMNVASLGGKPVLIGCAGADANGDMLIDTLGSAGVNCEGVRRSETIRTTTKVRVLAGQHYAARQQVIRIDYESPPELTDEIKAELRKNLARVEREADAMIVSDYGYGAVFPEIFADALAYSKARGIPLIVDSRFGLEKLANATTATPNREEVEQILGANFAPEDCSRLLERLGLRALLVTNGNQGMSLFDQGKEPLHIPAVGPTEPVDVTGAGDTVIAAYSLGLASDLGFRESAIIANHAGGIVVMKKGTAAATSQLLIKSLCGDGAELSSHAK